MAANLRKGRDTGLDPDQGEYCLFSVFEWRWRCIKWSTRHGYKQRRRHV